MPVKFHRVRDKQTGHEFTTARLADHLEVLAKPATNKNGKCLPPVPAKRPAPVAVVRAEQKEAK